MFESFTDESNAVIASAKSIARDLGHNYIGTEHILFGLITVDGDVSRMLGELGVTLDKAIAMAADRGGWTTDADALRALGIDPVAIEGMARENLGLDVEIRGIRPRPSARPSEPPDPTAFFTDRTKTVLEFSRNAAGTGVVEPRHILLGMLEEDGGLGVIVLDRLGVDLSALHSGLAPAG